MTSQTAPVAESLDSAGYPQCQAAACIQTPDLVDPNKIFDQWTLCIGQLFVSILRSKIRNYAIVYDGNVLVLNYETRCSSSAASQIKWIYRSIYLNLDIFADHCRLGYCYSESAGDDPPLSRIRPASGPRSAPYWGALTRHLLPPLASTCRGGRGGRGLGPRRRS